RDPWTGVPIVSLYGDSADSLLPRPAAFAGVALLLLDLQDVGSRYYTYPATGIWAALAAMTVGCAASVLDPPIQLSGLARERPRPAGRRLRAHLVPAAVPEAPRCRLRRRRAAGDGPRRLPLLSHRRRAAGRPASPLAHGVRLARGALRVRLRDFRHRSPYGRS